jgi:hypothetical protein
MKPLLQEIRHNPLLQLLVFAPTAGASFAQSLSLGLAVLLVVACALGTLAGVAVLVAGGERYLRRVGTEGRQGLLRFLQAAHRGRGYAPNWRMCRCMCRCCASSIAEVLCLIGWRRCITLGLWIRHSLQLRKAHS